MSAAFAVWLTISSIAVAILVTVVVAPLAEAQSHTRFADVIYRAFRYLCHQLPERSFHLGAAQLPVCARCFGLYVGAVAGAVAALRNRVTSRTTLRALIVMAAVPTAVTWSAEMLGLWHPLNATRFVAALPLGAAVAITVNYVGCAQRPRSGSRAHQTLT